MGIKITIPNTSSDTLTFGSANTTTAAQIAGIDSGSSNGQLAIYTTASGTSTERIRVDSSGNVGIGTSSPSYLVDIGSSSGTVDLASAGVRIRRSGVSNDWSLIDNVGGAMNFRQYDSTTPIIRWLNSTDGSTWTERMRIDSTGNVGIGTSSPASKLHVKGASNYDGVITADNSSTTGGGAFQIRQNGTVCGYYTTNGVAQGNTGSDIAIYAETGKAVTFFSGGSPTERMRIDSSGNLLVGTATASLTSGEGFKFFYNAGTNPYVGSVMSSSSNSQTNYHLYSTGAGAYRFYVGLGGTVYATITTITGISDQRLKENIRDLDDGLDKVMALQPRKFDWKEGKGADIKNARGFIAQEFETVFPDLIDEWKDPAPDGEEPYKSVRADLIPTLVKAIQEQQALIQTLTDRITALENK